MILIPEIPYEVESVAEAIRERSRNGKPFSIVAVAEGAISRQDFEAMLAARRKESQGGKKRAKKSRCLKSSTLTIRCGWRRNSSN